VAGLCIHGEESRAMMASRSSGIEK
jgi:hypothetical protein